MTWLRLSINVELGKPDPEPDQPHDSATDALVERADPYPIGFWPHADPTRHPDTED